jgi:hypothetical protein
MKIYQGTPTFLYCCLKQAYKNIFSSYTGLMPYEQFKEGIEKGKEIHFAGCLYQMIKR